MPRQQQWTIYEAAVLLDGVLQYRDNRVSKPEAILSVSNQLRKMAENRGQNIDDVYRNVNGITFQMLSMESALAGYTIIKPATRLFDEIVRIYREEYDRFNQILSEAKVMIYGNQMTNEEKFLTWLASKVSRAQLSELYGAYKEIEEFCRRIKVLKAPLFETLDYSVARKVQQTVESNKAFRFSHRKSMGKYVSAALYYCRYLKELPESQRQEDHGIVCAPSLQPPSASNALPVSHHISNAIPTSSEDDHALALPANDSDVATINFDSIPPLAYTKPISFSFFEKVTSGLRSWTDLYVRVFTDLYEKFPQFFHVGASFTNNGNGRIEFGDASLVDTMVAPKAIITTNGDKLYVETNLSANNLVEKIRFLLNLCSVGYDNLIITYSKTREHKTSVAKSNPALESAALDSPLQKSFAAWMLENGSALATMRSYTSAIRFAEKHAKEHSFAHQALFTEDHELAVMTTAELFADADFIECNKRQHNRFRAAITKLLEYYGVDYSFSPQTHDKLDVYQKDSPDISIDTTPFKTILAGRFIRGFRIGSPLDMRKFRRYYEMENEQELSISDDEVTRAILASGIQYDGKVFSPDVMLPAELREELFRAIRENLVDGKSAVYYEALFRSFSESFLDYYIYDANMLKAYIAFYNNGEFHLGNKYISMDATAEVNPQEEIKNYLIASGCPIDTEEICATLAHIPQQKVLQILSMNSEFVHNGRLNGKSYYFHVRTLHLTDEDLENISSLITDAIDEKTFISGNELIEMIEARHPYVLENNPLISTLGMRDALKYHLSGQFSFKGNIISSPNHSMSMTDVFGSYARSHNTFTVTELKTLAAELNATIYFDAVYDNSLRVSKEQFVSKEYAQFRVEDTDRAIARFCTGQFIPIGRIREFGTFPDAGYPWNIFLLEHFIYNYSKQFKLLHACFNRDSAVGAIVRRESGIDSFTDLLSVAFGESNLPIRKDDALSFFVEQGYLARRNYSDIEKVLIQANTYRNRKGTT